MKEKYKFSVIIPIYNVEKYLEEAILSVVNQTIGFKENIQMILINDGSPDNSEEICLKYKVMYPENIIYVHQENQGVSTARNAGIKYVEGKYTNFLDSDDKWELDVFEKVYDFFEKNEDEISLVACRIKNFEARDDFHPLDYKFDSNKIVDIDKDINAVQLSMATTFVKSDVIKDKKFDKNLKYGEDIKFVNEIILDYKKYGILRDAIYYYRRRLDESSAIQTRWTKKETYLEMINGYYRWLIEYSNEKFGKIIRYVQYVLMYDISFKLKRKAPIELLGEKETEEYITGLKNVLKNIDDDIILNKEDYYSGYKIYALSLKYDKDMTKELRYEKGKIYYKDKVISNIVKTGLNIKILEINRDKILIEGIINTFLDRDNYKVFVKCNDEKILIDLKPEEYKVKEGLERRIYTPQVFKIELDISKIKKISFIFECENEENKMNMKFGKFAKLSENIEETYYSSGKYIVTLVKNELRISKNTKKRHLKKEYNYLKELYNRKEYDVIKYRIFYYLMKNNKKEVWLFSDVNNDIAELFRCVKVQKNKKIKLYYIIDNKNDKYTEIRKYGKAIKRDSFKYKVYLLLAKKLISSELIEEEKIYDESKEYLKDLLRYKFIFLQQDVINNNDLKVIHRYDRNIKLFITDNKNEFTNKFGYTKNEVKDYEGKNKYKKIYEEILKLDNK